MDVSISLDLRCDISIHPIVGYNSKRVCSVKNVRIDVSVCSISIHRCILCGAGYNDAWYIKLNLIWFEQKDVVWNEGELDDVGIEVTKVLYVSAFVNSVVFGYVDHFLD